MEMTILVVEANTPERYAIVEALAGIQDVAVLGAVPGGAAHSTHWRIRDPMS